jgi:hypothetical protein
MQEDEAAAQAGRVEVFFGVQEIFFGQKQQSWVLGKGFARFARHYP